MLIKHSFFPQTLRIIHRAQFLPDLDLRMVQVGCF